MKVWLSCEFSRVLVLHGFRLGFVLEVVCGHRERSWFSRRIPVCSLMFPLDFSGLFLRLSFLSYGFSFRGRSCFPPA
ncbi:unnamed protein product [Brassica rapa subsp. trilocularis]